MVLSLNPCVKHVTCQLQTDIESLACLAWAAQPKSYKHIIKLLEGEYPNGSKSRESVEKEKAGTSSANCSQQLLQSWELL